MFNKTYTSLGITKNDYLTVANIDKKNNIVTLSSSSNKLISWDPEKTGGRRKGAVEVFESREQKLAVGDVIRWTRNNYQDNIYNGATAKVIKIKKDKVILQQQGDFGSEKTIKIDVSKLKNQHWDYAYSLTVHGLQGDTCDRILVNQDSYNKNLTTQKSFLVAISRARNEAHVFTDNKDEYVKVLQKYTGEKTTALEALLAKEILVQQESESKKNETTSAFGHDKDIGKSFSSNPKKQIWDASAISTMLTNKAEEVITQLLGAPKKVSGNFWRYGSNKGSLIVTMGGERRGLWYDFQTNSGGNLLTLIEEKMNLDFKGALECAGKLLGLCEQDLAKMPLKMLSKNDGENKTRAIDPANQIKTKAESKLYEVKEPPLSEHQLKMQHYARKLEHTSLPAKNTLVESYLREHRKIDITLPSSIRFHPRVWDSNTKQSYSAMLAIAKDKNGLTQAVQVTYLDPSTAKKAPIEQPKRTFGSLRGAAVKVNVPDISESESQRLDQQLVATRTAIAEGVETALSVATARPDLQVYATLGVANFASFTLFSPINCGNDQGEGRVKQLLICADNDGKNSDSRKLIDRVVNKLSEQKVDAIVITPPKDGQDFNDVLREEGNSAVRKIIDLAEGKIAAPSKSNEETKENIKDLARVYEIVAEEAQKKVNVVFRENSIPLNIVNNERLKTSQRDIGNSDPYVSKNSASKTEVKQQSRSLDQGFEII